MVSSHRAVGEANPAFGRASGAALLPYEDESFFHMELWISSATVAAASGASRIPLR